MKEVIIKSYKENYPNIVGFKIEKENITKKACILFTHGMAEHINRYVGLAKYLSNAGYICYGFDLLGHGKSVFKDEKVGIIKAPDFFDAVIECMEYEYNFIKEENKDLDVYLFAHSMSSMIAQNYIQKNPGHFNKVILSGTDIGSVKYKLLGTLLKQPVNKYGPYYYSKTVQKLSLDAFDKPFKKKLAWLSINEQNIINYINDPLCNESYPVGYFYSLATHLYESSKLKNIKRVKLDKILFLTGENDPVTNFSKSTKKIYKKYKKANLNSFIEILPNLRHETFHEDDETNLLVYNIIEEFYN
ncbi:MAG: alpha/beta hydrolase [Erysipelotrichaceae bacterium]|nr:alpha/beta hydrolase [Erysipelotrichaceae bacterium]